MSQRLLFRQEAIDFQRQNRNWGAVALLQPVSTKILAWFLAAVVALILVFLSIAQYARKETVVGYLTPTVGTAKIFVPQQGFVKELYHPPSGPTYGLIWFDLVPISITLAWGVVLSGATVAAIGWRRWGFGWRTGTTPRMSVMPTSWWCRRR